MQYFKLFVLSVFVFGLMIFLISLLFPGVTYVSRAGNVKGNLTQTRASLPARCSAAFEFPGIRNTYQHRPGSDTVTFSNTQNAGGMAVYLMDEDSTTLQVYYKVIVPWYQPWNKFALMLNEEKYGPQLDSVLARMQ